jgi:hypothetical protein
MVRKFRVSVRVALDGGTARIKALGTQAPHTLLALYSLIRRTCSLRPDLAGEVDLREASAGADIRADLQARCGTGQLPEGAGTAGPRCRLRILDPLPEPQRTPGPAKLSA